MNQQHLDIYMFTFANSIGNLSWYLYYIISCVYGLPLRREVREKLSQEQQYLDFYNDFDENASLIAELQTYLNNDATFFTKYVDLIVANNSNAERTKLSWTENSKRMADCLTQMNPYLKYTELTAMLLHLVDLLDTITKGLKRNDTFIFTNTVPICQRLIKDLSGYISSCTIANIMS